MIHFLKYHNAVPIIMGALFLSFGGALAASPEVRDAIYDETATVESIDNTYIANKDLASFTPTVRITGVTEDEEQYYVTYTLTTIDVIDYVWKDTTKDRTMTVAKAAIAGRDLGLYVTEQLRQVIDREISYLGEVQEIERQQVSQKTVATAYSGLIGAFLDETTEVLPGYVPVVVPPTPPSGQEGAPSSTGSSGEVAGDSTSTQTPSSGSTTTGAGSDQTPPTIQLLGNNPARILVGNSYSDMGAVVTDNVNSNLGYSIMIDGRAVTEVSIDTREEATYVIRYTATDQAGNSAYAERILEVYLDPSLPRRQAGTETPEPAPTDTGTSTATTTEE